MDKDNNQNSNQGRFLFDPNEIINLSNNNPIEPQSKPNYKHIVKKQPQANSSIEQEQHIENRNEENSPEKQTQQEEKKNSIQKNVKLEPNTETKPILNPNEVIQLAEKEEKKVANVKLENKIWNGHSWQDNPLRRYKIRVQKVDFTSLRYQCFCSRQYLSYCACYQHLRTQHPQFLQKNRRFSTTNIINMIDPVYGFKIKKIMMHRKKLKEGEKLVPGQNLSKRTKRRIRQQSPEIKRLLQELQRLDLERQTQHRQLDIIQKKIEKQEEIVGKYHLMIASFEKILTVLNIKPIIEGLKPGWGQIQYNDSDDEQYLP